MSVILLQELPLSETSSGSSIGIIIGLTAGIIISLAVYIYLSIAYSKIGKKTQLSNPGIAWMPVIGPVVIIFESSKAHWWPFLVATIGASLSYLLMLLLVAMDSLIAIALSAIVLIAISILLSVLIIIWHWKTYEEIDMPGGWILIPAISLVVGYILTFIGAAYSGVLSIIGIIITILASIIHLILIGKAAWSED